MTAQTLLNVNGARRRCQHWTMPLVTHLPPLVVLLLRATDKVDDDETITTTTLIDDDAN